MTIKHALLPLPYITKEIYKRLKDPIKPTEKNTIYRNQFYNLRQHASQTFSELLSELNLLYELWKFDDEGRCDSHKGCGNCKTTAKELCMKDALTLAITDNKLREDLRKLKGADNTLAKYGEASRLWNLDNSTKDAFYQNKTITSQDFHAMSNHQSETQSNDRVIIL